MKTITSALLTHFSGNLTTVSTCWKVTRRDGVILGFTDHDVSLTIDGLKYVASSGYYRTAISNSATTAADNLEVNGFLDDEQISETDLRNGAYDFAKVEIFAVNWADLSMGILRLRYGYFGEVVLRPSGQFTVELRGLMQLFSQTVGETIQPECRADLGDNRCKVKLIPDVRRSGGTYKEGDRVVVPTTALYNSVALPIANPSFDQVSFTSYGNWLCSGAVITNYPGTPHSGLFYVRPTNADGTGYVRREIQFEDLEAIELGQTASVNLWVKNSDPNYEIDYLFEFFDISFGDYTLIASHDTGYTLLPDSALAQLSASSGDQTLQAGTNALRVTVRWRPKEGFTPSAAPTFELSGFEFDQSVVADYSDPYMNLDYIPLTVNSSVVGWSGSQLFEFPGNQNLMPEDGSYMLRCSAFSFNSATQIVDISDIGADLNELDNGKYKLQLTTKVGALDWGQAANISATFKSNANGTGTTLAIATNGLEELRPMGIWFVKVLEFVVPAGTRSIILSLGAALTPERSSDTSQPNIGYDSISGQLLHVDKSPYSDFALYNGIEYEAQNDGVAAITVPNFTHTLDEEVTDGTVTWKAVAPTFAFLGVVDVVGDHATFTALNIDAPDNWFTWGVLTFLSGENRGRAVEVLSWNNTTKTFSLMLPVLMPIQPGDTFTVHAGCDKTRAITGCKKFNNILNYRGEPEVPGTDQYFRVGGTGASAGDSGSNSGNIL